MPSIIGIHAQAQQGKDLVCSMLTEILTKITADKWVRRAFADPVKDIFCNAFGVDRDFIEKWKVIPEPPTGFNKPIRQSLQFIGDGFRQIMGNCWINMAIKNLEFNTSCVISDGRYL